MLPPVVTVVNVCFDITVMRTAALYNQNHIASEERKIPGTTGQLVKITLTTHSNLQGFKTVYLVHCHDLYKQNLRLESVGIV